MNKNDTKPCFSAHMGPWLVSPEWINRALAAIKGGMYPEAAIAPTLKDEKLPDETNAAYEAGVYTKTAGNIFVNGTAIIEMRGAMMKGASKFGDTVSTVAVRRQVRDAMADRQVKSIVLAIESAGGHVAGTKELADDVKAAAAVKPVVAHIDDLGASAALWVASQATRVYANATAEVGSIGVVAVLHDLSGAYEREGVKVHVVSTGDLKGAGTAGTEITEEIIASVQDKVDALNEFFINAVAEGRNLTVEAVKEMATGDTFIAKKALALGLIDGIQTLDDTIAQSRLTNVTATGQRTAAMSAKHSLLKAQSRLNTVRNNF